VAIVEAVVDAKVTASVRDQFVSVPGAPRIGDR
jgi:hypothetical protein